MQTTVNSYFALARIIFRIYVIPMFDIPSEITRYESLAKKHGVSVDDLCVTAKVNRATWHRWKKAAYQPRMKVWERVTKNLATLLSKPIKASVGRDND